MSDDLESELAAAFTDHGADAATADDAAAKVAAFDAEYDLELTADSFLDTLQGAPYGEFENDFDYVIGDLAAGIEDCTDSREYRLSGYGDLAADPEQSV
jgi:hypothetical protein